MVVTELDSFVQKFHQLWKAGLNAHLDLDTHAGIAWVGLRVQLGHVPGPLHHQAPRKKNQDSPSRQRRRDRRAIARNTTAEEAAKTDSQMVSDPTEKVDEETLDEESTDVIEKVMENESSTLETIEEIVEDEHEAAAEAVIGENAFKCDICENKFNNRRGLRVHIGKKHKVMGSSISQLDGNNDSDCDMTESLTYTFVSDYHREDVEYTLEEVFPKDVETQILSCKKVGDRSSADHLFSVSIQLPDDRKFSWPDMSADQVVVIKNVQMQDFPA